MNRGYDWLVTRLAVPAVIWLVPTIWVVSLSFQPNEVLVRTTSSTALGVCRSRSRPRTTAPWSLKGKRRGGFCIR